MSDVTKLTDDEKAEILDWVSACQSAYHIDSTPGHRFGGLGSNLEENRNALIEYVDSIIEARIAANGAEPVVWFGGNNYCTTNREIAERFNLRAAYAAPFADSAMAKDAERYRWWRNWVFRAGNDGLPTCTYLAEVEEPADIDAAIDAAIAASAEKTGD